jgi:hypothetical protein
MSKLPSNPYNGGLQIPRKCCVAYRVAYALLAYINSSYIALRRWKRSYAIMGDWTHSNVIK